jgi:hypothetical protein
MNGENIIIYDSFIKIAYFFVNLRVPFDSVQGFVVFSLVEKTNPISKGRERA